jgi:ABC-type oligopeptide transport system substrate-binding subunit
MADAIVFLFGQTPADTLARFRAGQCSIAFNLAHSEVEACRQDPSVAPGYRETPSLSTYGLFFNVRQGVFANVELRRAIAANIDVAEVVRSLGKHVVEAHSFLPPGLVGYEPLESERARGSQCKVCDIDVSCLVHPIFEAQYAPAARILFAELRRLGVRLKLRTGLFNDQRKAECDLYFGRWNGDYPDPDTFIQGVLHSQAGAFAEICGLPVLDAMSERARAESDPRTRHALYREIERKIRDDAWLVPLFHDKHYYLGASNLRGIDDALGTTTRGVDYAPLWIED